MNPSLFFQVRIFSPVHLTLHGTGRHAFSLLLVFKDDFSAKLLEISLFTAKANLFATHASDWPIHGCDSFKICVEQEGPDVEESRPPAQESPRQQHTAIRLEQDLA